MSDKKLPQACLPCSSFDIFYSALNTYRGSAVMKVTTQPHRMVTALVTQDNQILGVTLQHPQECCSFTQGWARPVLRDARLQPQGHTRGLQPLWTAIPWCSLCHFTLSLKQGPSRPLAQRDSHTLCSASTSLSIRGHSPSAVGRSLKGFSLGNAPIYLLLKVVSCSSSLSPNCAIRPQVQRSSFSIPCHH